MLDTGPQPAHPAQAQPAQPAQPVPPAKPDQAVQPTLPVEPDQLAQPAQPSAHPRSSQFRSEIPTWGDQTGSTYATPMGNGGQEPRASGPSITFAMANDRRPRHVENDLDSRSRSSRHSTVSGTDEEAEVSPMTRMLADSTGRLLYLGDSATLAYLQLIRNSVEREVGTSPFTQDPSMHRIMEATMSIPPALMLPPFVLLPPTRETTLVLAKSFFTHTMGLIEVFDREYFKKILDACYHDPLHVHPHDVCLLYLVFAIGLVLANPAPDSEEEGLIANLRNDQNFNWPEAFFGAAKHCGDPMSGFEDADLWSVQALILMSVYMLSISRRNSANAYYGMAVRSAFALGLHREETLPMFAESWQRLRRNLWKTLFILDRFLSASLGRPIAILEDDCSEALLDPLEPSLHPESNDQGGAEPIHSEGRDAVIRSTRVIGAILKKVYSKRKISTALTQEIAGSNGDWLAKLHPSLHWTQITNRSDSLVPAHGIAVLHVNLFQCHSTILLSRPFFLFMIRKTQELRLRGIQPSSRAKSKMEKFSQSCVEASYHTINLVQMARLGKYLTRRDPFILYFLFAASLVVLSNEFFGLFRNETYEAAIDDAVSITKYCSATDPQARRLLYILTEFRTVVREKGPTSSGNTAVSALPGSAYDPTVNFSGTRDSTAGRSSSLNSHQTSSSKLSDISRHKSFAGPMVSPSSEAISHSSTIDLKPEPGMHINGIRGMTPPPSTSGRILSQGAEFFTGMPVPTGPEHPESLGETEFDFDCLWPMPATEVPTDGTGALSVPALPPNGYTTHVPTGMSSGYHGYVLQHGAGPHGISAMGMSGNIPMYPSNFM